MKKMFLIIFLVLFLFSLFPYQIEAGLVPCGLKEDDPNQPEDQTSPCQLCHLFVLFKNIIDFLLIPSPLNNNIPLVPLIAVLFLVIGGVMYILAYLPGSPFALQQANQLFASVAWGLFIVYGAWLIVNLFFQVIGVQSWTGLKTWWQISCPL